MAILNINDTYDKEVPVIINEALNSMPGPDTRATIEKIAFIFAFIQKDADNWKMVTTTETITYPDSLPNFIFECKESMLKEWHALEGEKALKSIEVIFYSSDQTTNPQGELVKSQVSETLSLELLRFCTHPTCTNFETTARKIDLTCNGCNKGFYCSEECRSAHSLQHKKVCVLSGNSTKAA